MNLLAFNCIVRSWHGPAVIRAKYLELIVKETNPRQLPEFTATPMTRPAEAVPSSPEIKLA